MKRLLAVAVLAMAVPPCAVHAQETATGMEGSHNVAADFSRTSAANTNFIRFDNASADLGPFAAVGFAGSTFPPPLSLYQPLPAGAAASGAEASGNTPAAPEPRFIYGGRDDYRWQLGLGVAVVRFRSSVYYATAVGLNTDLAYFLNEWFAVEGSATAAFAPPIFQNEHVKFLGYDIGPKIAWRQRKWEPWAHILFGGAHIQPQTADAGRNGYEIEAGGGVDYRFNPTFGARAEVDWLRTGLFGRTQNSAQAVLGGVFHF